MDLIKVEISECDKEPIHIPGKILAHGLFVATDHNFNITHISNNLFRYLGVHGAQVLGKNLLDISTILKDDLDSTVCKKVGLKDFEEDFIDFEMKANRQDNHYLFDFYPLVDQTKNDVSFLEVSKKDDVIDALKEIQILSRCDRVKLYLFNAIGDGQVVEEIKSFDCRSFLNHWFPAGDIPQRARDLYIAQKIRFISDINTPAISIISHDGKTQIDLTQSLLRAVSPIHIEYLANMGVTCSLSTSLVRENQLIGLIACHSYSPIQVSFSTLEQIGKISEMLENYLNQEFNRKVEKTFSELLDLWRDRETHEKSILELFQADQVDIIKSNEMPPTLWDQNDCYFSSKTTPDQLKELHSKDYPGIACVQLDEGQSLVLRRKTVEQSKDWGGVVSSKIPYRGLRLEPRKSFETYRENLDGHSREWSLVDRAVLKKLSSL